MHHEEDSSTLGPYYEALERLKKGKPVVVSKGTKINLNSVALEAGRSAGSIKKSRVVYEQLIQDVKDSARAQIELSEPGRLDLQASKAKTAKAKAQSDEYEEKYKAALARELMLLAQLSEVEQKLKKVTNVHPIRKGNKDSTSHR
ncbi:hypothetical protein [Pseudomonas sp. FEN]|uniref:hypothetical protein n=1 Tax=Pseudomonas sp. FEN TaxID=2767468 RepID=UPI00174857AB|nr:hypothetical protein [Pseudomonas sp. FEN]